MDKRAWEAWEALKTETLGPLKRRPCEAFKKKGLRGPSKRRPCGDFKRRPKVAFKKAALGNT